MSDTIQVKLPGNTITLHLPALAPVEALEERVLSDGETRILSDGDTRVIFDGEYDNIEVIRIKVPNGVIPVHLEG